MAIQITKFIAKPNVVDATGITTLELTVRSKIGTSLKIYFFINADNNVYFRRSGVLVKEFVVTTKLRDSIQDFFEEVELVKVESTDDFSEVFIYSEVENRANQLFDIRHCRVGFTINHLNRAIIA